MTEPNAVNKKIKNFAIDTLFPCFCQGCQKEGSFLCPDCQSLLEISEYNYCLCEKDPTRLFGDPKNGKCPRCQDRKLSGLYFALSYKEKTLTKKLIHNFKYEPFIKDLAKPLAGVLIEHFVLTGKNTNAVWDNSVLIPVPLDTKRIKWRGYNQSEELAKELSKILLVPVVSDCLVKIKKTETQMELKKAEREKNLQGAFSISSHHLTTPVIARSRNDEAISPFDLHNKKVFLVDDVYTTGSTMQECAKVLKQAGAKQVWGITIAREG